MYSKKGNDMELVVKSNKLNMAIQNLSLTEIRLIQIGIIDAREQNKGLSADTPLTIDAQRYADAFDVSRQAAYDALIQAEVSLFERRFSFLDEKDNKVKSRWISQAKYLKGQGAIEIIFTPAVVNEISRINGIENFFTKYTLEQTANMNSIYSVRLYELLVQWRTAKKTPLFELSLFRKQLGLDQKEDKKEYKEMRDFKKRVLDLAVDEINEKSDLIIEYDTQKNGRKIVGFEFKISNKAKQNKTQQIKDAIKTVRDQNTADMFTIDGLTDRQLKRITLHKDFVSTYSNLAKGDAGKSWSAFSEYMIDEIKKNPDFFNKKRPIREYLDGSKDDYHYV